MIHDWRTPAPFPPLTPQDLGRGRGALEWQARRWRSQQAARGFLTAGKCALPPPVGTRPAGGRAKHSTPAWALRAAGPALRQRRPHSPAPARPPPACAPPCPRRALPGAAGQGGARGRDAGRGLPTPEGGEPVCPSRFFCENEAAGARPAACVLSKIGAWFTSAAPGISQLPLWFGFVPTLGLIVLSPAWTLTPFPSPPPVALPRRSQSVVLNRLPGLATVWAAGLFCCPSPVYQPT